jgi:hypothetical protein
MLFGVMEQMANAVTTASALNKAMAQRPVFGPTRVSVLRRVDEQCTSGRDEPKRAQRGEEVVEALVQSGTVREGQLVEALLPAPIVFARRSGRGRIQPKPTTVASFSVVSIERLEKSRYRRTCCVMSS